MAKCVCFQKDEHYKISIQGHLQGEDIITRSVASDRPKNKLGKFYKENAFSCYFFKTKRGGRRKIWFKKAKKLIEKNNSKD